MFSTGVTRFFPTVITGIAGRHGGRAAEPGRGARIDRTMAARWRLFTSKARTFRPKTVRAARIRRRWVRPPDFDEFHRWQEAAQRSCSTGHLVAGVAGRGRATSNRSRREGVVVSIGHTNATAAADSAMRSAPARRFRRTSATAAHPTLTEVPELHLGSAGRGSAGGELHRRRYPSGRRVSAGRAARQGHRAQRADHRCRDAGDVRAGILSSSARSTVELKEDQRVVLRGGTRLAGSSLRMDRAIENVMRLPGVSLRDAVTMATINPARVGRIGSRQRGLRTGGARRSGAVPHRRRTGPGDRDVHERRAGLGRTITLS